jgi:WD40 repeat protein
MCIARCQGQTLGFVTLEQGRAWGVRIWDLDGRQEIPTKYAYHLWAGEEDKVMRGLAVAPRATWVRLAFASKYGKVMVADFGASGAEQKHSPWGYDEWHIPNNDGEYVNALATSPAEAGLSGTDHALLLAAASAYGTIAIWNFLDGTLLARRPRAHLGDIPAMQFGYRAGQTVLATGGDDGVLRVWTTELDELLRIEIGERIEALTFLGADRIAVGGQRGVLMLGILEDSPHPSSPE